MIQIDKEIDDILNKMNRMRKRIIKDKYTIFITRIKTKSNAREIVCKIEALIF